jgi:hypothetical protein
MKFLVFITLLVAGWYVMRWLQQFETNRRLHSERSGGRTGGASPKRMRATDTIVCSRCGTYVPSDFPTACDRTGCPFPGVG